MIDLKKIEEEVDNLLANETPESMMAWLASYRVKEFINHLGEGSWVNLNIQQINSFFGDMSGSQQFKAKANNKIGKEIMSANNFKIAA